MHRLKSINKIWVILRTLQILASNRRNTALGCRAHGKTTLCADLLQRAEGNCEVGKRSTVLLTFSCYCHLYQSRAQQLQLWKDKHSWWKQIRWCIAAFMVQEKFLWAKTRCQNKHPYNYTLRAKTYNSNLSLHVEEEQPPSALSRIPMNFLYTANTPVTTENPIWFALLSF